MSNASYWANIIRRIAPNARQSIVTGLSEAMPQVIKIANLTTSQRLAQFLAQIAHESDGFRTTVEYGSGKEYNGRKDLGNIYPNDGPLFKGRGLIQLTGRNNYNIYGRQLGVDFVNQPVLAANFPYAALTAAQYWKDNNLNVYADEGNITMITRRINGGLNGFDDRKKYLKIAESELSDLKLAQQRLVDLNYPLGAVDGISGPLTRSAIRDFQDANELPVNGMLDTATKEAIFSPDAKVRPVSDARAALTAVALKDSGSQIIAGTDQAKVGAIGGAVATVAGISNQASEIAANVKDISNGIKSGAGIVPVLEDHWQVIVMVILFVLCCFFAWMAYRGAKKAEENRVQNARLGVNVMR